jgi:23S rRNA (cytosine1962-C5)-methyltransferase
LDFGRPRLWLWHTLRVTAQSLAVRLSAAIDARAGLVDDAHRSAFRLFNGFLEGAPGLVLDVYGTTMVIHDHAEPSDERRAEVGEASVDTRERLPWLRAVVVKPRKAADPKARRGFLEYGASGDVATRVCEDGVWYALELLVHRDAGFYVDTRGLRAWARAHLAGARVLNTFAHTGSLGVAAMAGGAARVLHVDLNRRFLNVAKASYTLNGFPIRKLDFAAGDFFTVTSGLIRRGELFDCVFVDPPFFSATRHGTVDLVSESHRVINKVRPLVAHGGWLVAVNNAKFVSGAGYMALLEQLCVDGYLSIESTVPIPWDVTGHASTRFGDEPTDPLPFNHATKIAVLRVLRKDQRTS